MSERPKRSQPPHLNMLRDVVHAAAREDRVLWICGGATRAETPPAGVTELRMPRFDEVLDYWPDDMTIRAPAGMTLARLNEILAGRGQELPIDAAAPQRATVGGLVATGLSGSRRLARGTVRDALLGLTQIDADGAVLEFGGRVVKNVAGYDMCKLLLGSWGCLGLIVDATFRVRARPESSRAVVLEPASPAAAESWCAALLASPLAPASIDWVDASLARRWGLAQNPLLIVGYEGLHEDVEGRIRRTQSLLSVTGAALERGAYTELREHIAQLALCDPGHLRASLSSSAVMYWVGRLRDLDSNIAVAAHLGSGVLLLDFSAAAPEALSRVVSEMDEHRVPWIVPRSPVRAASAPMTRFSSDALRLLRSVKTALDPQALFGRGSRFARAAELDTVSGHTGAGFR